MGTPLDIYDERTAIRFDAEIFLTIEPHLFDANWLRDSQLWHGNAKGRGQAHFFKYLNRDMVLRHFHRGGLIGRMISDRFLRLGIARSRAFREFDLLHQMRSMGLAVPRPVAAQHKPAGLFYRAAIITERIPNARTLCAILCERSLPSRTWTAIGAAIKELHSHSVFHSDLNCRNIMIDAEHCVWIIDFDKCYVRKPGSWRQDNLDRLQRSLRKTASQVSNFYWHEDNWASLLTEYSGDGSPK
ncbi:3-deoxy-D-manno-octulosonic acid kinase [Pseudopelagicola sp. nBUS_20]|uniref:3-deoxy-D-manno-octulosonic acid kinase n=1 Tax=Pseudopelagicola sp. nBUS_20 TaxID=3395317 RepID=UPI003EBFFF5B